MKTIQHLFIGATAALLLLTLNACHDDDDNDDLGGLTPAEDVFGKSNEVFSAAEWYPGGQLGTTTKASYSAPSPAVEHIAGMEEDFNTGEDFFEHLYTFEQQPRRGLGPAWVRNGFIFYNQAWRSEPIVRVKDGPLCRHLGLRPRMSFNDFFTDEGYVLGTLLREYHLGGKTQAYG